MAIIRDMRRRAGRVWAPILGLSLIAYFAYHTVQGERGIRAWLLLRQQLQQAQAELDRVQSERAILENRVSRLSDRNLDIDLLDERVRILLNYTAESEWVVFQQPSERTAATAPHN